MKQNIKNFFAGLNRDSVVRIVIWTIFSLIFLLGIRSCSHGGPSESDVGNGIWILLGGGLIVAAVMTREHGRLPYCFAGIAVGIILILLGKLETLFSWAVIGLPILATTGIWGWTKTEGRTKSFLGFVSGLIILFWMHLFYQDHSIKNTEFIGEVFFANKTATSIFLIFLAVFLFATWKRSKFFYLISFLVLLSFIGDTMVSEIKTRFPKKLLTPISSSELVKKTTGAIGNLVETFATKADASASRSAIESRKASQIQKTWKIAPETKIYDCSKCPLEDKSLLEDNYSCTLAKLKYGVETEIISLNEVTEINGITYEKCSLPDITTGQPGSLTRWIRSVDLVGKSAKPKNTDNKTGKSNLVATVASSNNRFANALAGGKTLGPGNYYQAPIGKTSFQFAGESSPRIIGNGKNFTILPKQKVVGIRTNHPSISIYKN